MRMSARKTVDNPREGEFVGLESCRRNGGRRQPGLPRAASAADGVIRVRLLHDLAQEIHRLDDLG